MLNRKKKEITLTVCRKGGMLDDVRDLGVILFDMNDQLAQCRENSHVRMDGVDIREAPEDVRHWHFVVNPEKNEEREPAVELRVQNHPERRQHEIGT